MFLLSFSKCSNRFSNLHFIAVNPVTYLPVCNITFVLHWVLFLWGHKYFLDGTFASEVCVDVILTAYPFDGFTKTFYRHYVHVVVFVASIVRFVVLEVFQSIYGPWWALALVLTSLVCCNSVLKSFGVDETVLPLRVKLLIILYLVPMW